MRIRLHAILLSPDAVEQMLEDYEVMMLTNSQVEADARNWSRRWRASGLAVSAEIILVITVVIVFAVFATAGAPDDIEWLTTFDVDPRSEIGVWTLVDSTSVWPSARPKRLVDAINSGLMQDYPYMFKNKGDYLRVVVYVDAGECWVPTPDTRIVFDYGDLQVEAVEVLLLSLDLGTMDIARTVYSSRTGLVADPAATGLVRSRDGGFRGYLRFPPDSLPRPARGWFFGGNRWGVKRPVSVRVEEGRGVRCVRP